MNSMYRRLGLPLHVSAKPALLIVVAAIAIFALWNFSFFNRHYFPVYSNILCYLFINNILNISDVICTQFMKMRKIKSQYFIIKI